MALAEMGFPVGSHGKKSTYNAGDVGLILGLVRSPGERSGYPLQYSYLDNSMDRGACGLQPIGWQTVGHDWVTLSLSSVEISGDDRLPRHWPIDNLYQTQSNMLSISGKNLDAFLYFLKWGWGGVVKIGH